MSRFTSRPEHLGAWPVLALIDSETGMAVRIAHRGATVLDFLVPVAGELRDIADGFATAEELETAPAARFSIMAPFANRVADARYTFEGREYDLLPGVSADRGIRHGFTHTQDFELLAVDADGEGVRACFGYHGLRPGAFPGYPFTVDVEVAYTLHAGGLDLTASMRNPGTTAAPCFFGWHPYFRLREDGIDGCELHVPAHKLVRMDEALIPLPGEQAFAEVGARPEMDFRRPRLLGDTVMDDAYAELEADPDGRIRTRFRDPESGFGLALWQESGVTLAFSGDTLGEGEARRSLAIEPMQSMTNAYNRPDCLDAIRLEAGAERVFRCGVELLQD